MVRRSPNSSRPVRPSSTPAKRKGILLTPLAQQMPCPARRCGRSGSFTVSSMLPGFITQTSVVPPCCSSLADTVDGRRHLTPE